MADFQRKIINYVTYSDETEKFLRIGLVHYSEKSFAFAIEYLNALNKDTLSKEQKILMESVKKFFSKSDDPEYESLGGTGNTKLDYGDGNKFFGYIYSIQTGQKAIDWYATRSALLPTRKTLEKKVPQEYEKGSDDYEEYLDVYSRKTKEELYELLGMSEAKAASKYQKKPFYTTQGPTFKNKSPIAKSPKTNVLIGKATTEPIVGMPTSTRAKKPTLKEALEVVLTAMLDGTFENDYVFTKNYDPDDNEEAKTGFVIMGETTVAAKKKAKEKFMKDNKITDEKVLSEIKGPSFFIFSQDKIEDND